MKRGDLNQMINRYEKEISKMKVTHKSEMDHVQSQIEELNETIRGMEQELILKESQMLDSIAAVSQTTGEDGTNRSQTNSMLTDSMKQELVDLRNQCKLYKEDQTFVETLKRLTMNGNDPSSITNNGLPFSEYTKLMETNRNKTDQIAELRSQLREAREEKYALKLRSAEYEKMLMDAQSQFEAMRDQEANLYREIAERDSHISILEQQIKDVETEESLLAEIEKELRQLRSANEQLKLLHGQEKAMAEAAITEKEKIILQIRMSFERDLEHYKMEHEANQRNLLELTKRQLETVFESRLASLQSQLDEKERRLVTREKDLISVSQDAERKLSETRHEKEVELLRLRKELLVEKEKQLEEFYLQSERERREAVELVESQLSSQIRSLTSLFEEQKTEIGQLHDRIELMLQEKEESTHTHMETVQHLGQEWMHRLNLETQTLKQEHQAILRDREMKSQQNFDLAIEHLNNEHQDHVQSLNQHYQEQYDSQLRELTMTHENAFRQLDAQWNSKLKTELTRLQQQISQNYSEELRSIETQHADSLREIHKQHETTRIQWHKSQKQMESTEVEIHRLREHIRELESSRLPTPVRVNRSTQSDLTSHSLQQLNSTDIRRIEEKLKGKMQKSL